MVGIINAFIDICLFRTGPQHLPASRTLLGIVVVCNLIAGTLMLKVSTPVVQAFMMAAVDTVLLFILANVALKLRNHLERLLQTLTALIGTSTLMSLIAWPVSAWFNSAAAAGSDAGLPSILILLMLFWNIGIIGHILRHALGISLASGIGLSVLYVFLAIYISAMLFPA